MVLMPLRGQEESGFMHYLHPARDVAEIWCREDTEDKKVNSPRKINTKELNKIMNAVHVRQLNL